MTPTVPICLRSAGPGASESLTCSDMNSSRSPVKARFTASIEVGRFTAIGVTLIGNATMFRSGSTGSDEGMDGVDASAMLVRIVSFDDVFERTGLLHREAGNAPDAADMPALQAAERLPAALGPADQEGPHSFGRRRARSRALREAARLHDSNRRRRELPDVPHAVRSAVPSVAGVPAVG